MATNQFEYADLREFKGHSFESLCYDLLVKSELVRIEQTKKSRDGGKDLIIYDRNGDRIFVECKTTSGTIG